MGSSFIERSDKQMAGEALVKADVAEQLSKACLKDGPLLQKKEKSGNNVNLWCSNPS